MEHIDGEIIHKDLWNNSLSKEGRTRIGTEIGKMLEKLASVPSQGYYGRIDHRPFPALFPLLQTTGDDDFGPYYTYEDLVEDIHKASKVQHATMNNERKPELSGDNKIAVAFLKDALLRCAGQEPRLTYFDIKFDNMMLKPIPGKEKIEGADFEIIFIDWFHLGWLPGWYQSCSLPSEATETELNNKSKEYGKLHYNESPDLNWNVIKEMSSFYFEESRWMVGYRNPIVLGWGIW